ELGHLLEVVRAEPERAQPGFELLVGARLVDLEGHQRLRPDRRPRRLLGEHLLRPAEGALRRLLAGRDVDARAAVVAAHLGHRRAESARRQPQALLDGDFLPARWASRTLSRYRLLRAAVGALHSLGARVVGELRAAVLAGELLARGSRLGL